MRASLRGAFARDVARDAEPTDAMLLVVVHGDGTSLWTLTHHEDFAKGFVPLLGNPRTVGDTFLTIAMHQMNHRGQVADARRVAGRKPVFTPVL